eukprot:1062206-Prymnesium_polylepis.3
MESMVSAANSVWSTLCVTSTGVVGREDSFACVYQAEEEHSTRQRLCCGEGNIGLSSHTSGCDLLPPLPPPLLPHCPMRLSQCTMDECVRFVRLFFALVCTK